jgi:hypothetical protein
VNGNTIKIYDKAYAAEGNILRVETTVNNVEDFRTYRKAEGDEEGKEKWLPMRKGIADLHRRAEVSEAANERYWNALASIDDSATVEELVRIFRRCCGGPRRPMGRKRGGDRHESA